MKLSVFICVLTDCFRFCRPMGPFHTVSPQLLHRAAVQHSFHEIMKYTFRILAGCGDGPHRRTTFQIFAHLFDGRKGDQFAVMLVGDQIGFHIGRPGPRPIGKCAEFFLVEFIAAVLCPVGKRLLVYVPRLVCFLQAGNRRLHGIFRESVHPFPIFFLIERRVRILIEFRQIIHVRRFLSDQARCRNTIGIPFGPVSIRIPFRECFQHIQIFLVIGGSGQITVVQPFFLDIGKASVSACRSKSVKLAVQI